MTPRLHELLDVIGHLREVTRTLHPAGLDQLGLVAALRGLLADVGWNITGHVRTLKPRLSSPGSRSFTAA